MEFVRAHPLVLGLYLVIAVIGMAVAVSGMSETDRPRRRGAGDLHRLELVVTGSGAGSVSYVTPGSDPIDVSQSPDVPLPWRKVFPTVERLQGGFNLVAQRAGKGRIGCRVLWDGEVVAEDTARGPAAMVTCAPSGDDRADYDGGPARARTASMVSASMVSASSAVLSAL